jgi:hypothetical protein
MKRGGWFWGVSACFVRVGVAEEGSKTGEEGRG